METRKNRNGRNNGAGIILTACLAMCMLSCSKKNIPEQVIAFKDLNDTTLYADSIYLYNGTPEALTNSITKKVLEDYYKPKGFYPEGALSLDSLLGTNDSVSPRCFNFLDLRKINIKNRRYPLGIVRYFKCDCFENGNHVRPHTAMITANENGDYILVNEDFLPDHYYIDNILGGNGILHIKDSILDRSHPPTATPYTAKIILK
ncbi:MAG: hypothetical protein ACOVRN_12260 [Flavobacterium sp.]